MSQLQTKTFTVNGVALRLRQLGVGEFVDAAEAEGKAITQRESIMHALSVVSVSAGIGVDVLEKEYSAGTIIAAYRETLKFSIEGIPDQPGKAQSP